MINETTINNKLNVELVKLEEELKLLDIAVKHIDKAKTLSTVVVEAVRSVPQRIEKHLADVAEKFTEYLGTAQEYNQQQTDALTQQHGLLLDSTRATLDEYKRMAADTEARSLEIMKRSFDSYINFVNQTTTQQEQKFNAMQATHGEQIEAAGGMLNEYKQLAEASDERSNKILTNGLAEYKNYLEMSRKEVAEKLDEHLQQTQNAVEELSLSHRHEVGEMHSVILGYKTLGDEATERNKEQWNATLDTYKDYLSEALKHQQKAIDNISAIHTEEVKAVEQFTAEFVELSGITTRLTDKVDSIDFPVRLQKIEHEITELNTAIIKLADKQQTDADDRLKQLTDKLELQDKQLVMQRWLTISAIALVFIVLIISIVK